jgi:hypothetical protein
MSQSSILVDALSSAYLKKKREKWPRAFFPWQTCPVGCAVLGFFPDVRCN